MADQTSPIQQVAAGSNALDRVNENFDAASPALLFGRDARTTAGLTWGYVGGRWGGIAISNGTVALTASAANYVVVHRATGVVSVGTSTAQWDDTATYSRAYKVTTGAATVTDYEDHRAGAGGILQPVGGDSVGVTLTDAAASSTLPTAGSLVSIKVLLQMTRDALKWLITRFNSSGQLSVAYGGTGAGDAAGARANLGAEPTVAAGTVAQYRRGDKSWQYLDTAVRAALMPSLGTNAFRDETVLYGSAAGTATAIAAAARPTVSIAVPGAELGDFVQISLSVNAAGIEPTGYVSAANTVAAVEPNPTASGITLGVHTIYARVTKRAPE